MTGTNLDPSVTATDFFGNLTGNVTGNITGAFSGTTVTASGAITGASGTVSLPEFTFTGDTDSGIYRIGANNIGVAVNATKILDIATTGLGVTGAFTATSVDAPVGSVTPAAGTFTNLASTGTQKGSVAVIAAAGATQGSATLIGAVLNVIVTATASTEGVKLPVATTGREVRIFSSGTVGALVYPNTNGKIESSSTNTAVLIAAGKGNLYVAKNTTQWFVVKGA